MAIIPSDEKVFMVSNSTNTVYGGSAAMQAMTKWYTMEDVTNTVRPYQVFTALLTQSGGSSEVYTGGGALTKGVTYFIDGASPLSDFTNVGGPAIGTTNVYFVAINNETPNNYDGAALYSNAGAPVATVLENTIGNIWFTYIEGNYYGINSTNGFVGTIYFQQDRMTYGLNDALYFFGDGNKLDDNTFVFSTTDYPDLNRVNGALYNTPIEIRVYN
jgi:hypothetical protein